MKTGQPVHVRGPLWLLPGENQGRFPRCHAVLIKGRAGKGGGPTVLIDPGCGPQALGPWAREADLVLLSHTHPDHSSQAHLCAGRELLVPAEAADTAGDLTKLGPRFAEPQRTAYWREFVTTAMGLADYAFTGTFQDGREINAGGYSLVCLATPGHTADHYCFQMPELDLVIAADIDLTPFGPWYGHTESDIPAFRESIARVAGLKAGMLVPGHLAPVEQDIPARLAAFEAVIDAREERLLAFLHKPRTLEEITDAALIYGAFQRIPVLLRYWEGEMQAKHLGELMAQGRVVQRDGGFLAVS